MTAVQTQRSRRLSPAQRETLQLVADGRTLAEVAAVRGVAYGTTRSQATSIRLRLGTGAHTLAGAVAVGMRAGEIT